MIDVVKILQNNGIQLINDIRANLGSVNATHETERSLRIEVSDKGLKLLGRPFFMTVQTGRRPTPEKKPSREMIERITAWVEARGMNLSAVWAIATKIQQRGTRLWLEGGRTDIVDPAVDDFVNNMATDLLNSAADDLILKVKTMKW